MLVSVGVLYPIRTLTPETKLLEVEKSFETKNVKMGASESVLIHQKNRLMKVNREMCPCSKG